MSSAGRPEAIGRYQVVRRLGVGGMAEVFLVRRRGRGGFEKQYVVKRLLPHLSADPAMVEQLAREARIGALLDHPHIVHTLDLDEDDAGPFLVLEYVEGRTLREVAKGAWGRGSSLPLEFVLSSCADVALALDHLHHLAGPDGQPLGLIHRDLSPDNLLVGKDGVCRLMDFGVARMEAATIALTGEGELKGKIPFMAPEQLKGEGVDHRVDLYALGVTLYWLLSGRRPFEDGSDLDGSRVPSDPGVLIPRVLSTPVEPPITFNPEIPAGLNDLVVRLLAKDKEQRPQRGAEIYDALRALGYVAQGAVRGFVDVAVTRPPPEEGAPARPAQRLATRALTQALPVQAGPGDVVTSTTTAPGGWRGLGATKAAAVGAAGALLVFGSLFGFLALVGNAEAVPTEPPPMAEPPEPGDGVAGEETGGDEDDADADEDDDRPRAGDRRSDRRSSDERSGLRELRLLGPDNVEWMVRGKKVGEGIRAVRVDDMPSEVVARSRMWGGEVRVPVRRGVADYRNVPTGRLIVEGEGAATATLGRRVLKFDVPYDIAEGTYELVIDNKPWPAPVEIEGKKTLRIRPSTRGAQGSGSRRAADSGGQVVSFRAPVDVVWSLRGKPLGNGTFDRELPPGTRSVEAKGGPWDGRFVVPVEDGVASVGTLPYGYLDVRIGPGVASVQIGTKRVPRSERMRLPEGEYTVVWQPIRGPEEKRRFTVKRNETTPAPLQ